MSMLPYTSATSRRQTPQSEAIFGEQQVQNNAGGFVYAITPWQQAERFLILGTESGTYYVGERKLTKENALVLQRCLDEDGEKVVRMIVDISDKGRAPSNDPAVFALWLETPCHQSDKE